MQIREFGMRTAKVIAAALILALGLMLCAGAGSEATAVDTEENGRVTKTVWTDEAGNLTAGPEGYAEVRYTYKGKTETTEKYFDENGAPFLSAEGCHGKRTTLDGKGRVVQIDWLDAAGEKTLNIRGYASMTITYTASGKPGW